MEAMGHVAIACDPEVPGLIYVGSMGGGVYVSRWGGSFTPMTMIWAV